MECVNKKRKYKLKYSFNQNFHQLKTGKKNGFITLKINHHQIKKDIN